MDSNSRSHVLSKRDAGTISCALGDGAMVGVGRPSVSAPFTVGPAVQILLPPARSLQTFGPSGVVAIAQICMADQLGLAQAGLKNWMTRHHPRPSRRALHDRQGDRARGVRGEARPGAQCRHQADQDQAHIARRSLSRSHCWWKARTSRKNLRRPKGVQTGARPAEQAGIQCPAAYDIFRLYLLPR